MTVPVKAKICGLSTPETVAAAVDGGAAFVGFMMFPRSPRAVTVAQAAALVTGVPESVTPVGVFVDADDDLLAQGLAAGFRMLQLHGNEDPARVAAIRARFGVPVMKVVAIETAADLAAAEAFSEVADWLLFDAKAPRGASRPGGNAVAFDWRILAGWQGRLRWMLAGGLDADNVGLAIETSGAAWVDVSSGVETAPGRKSGDKIRAFLRRVAAV